MYTKFIIVKICQGITISKCPNNVGSDSALIRKEREGTLKKIVML
jgi:hypothetical protein